MVTIDGDGLAGLDSLASWLEAFEIVTFPRTDVDQIIKSKIMQILYIKLDPGSFPVPILGAMVIYSGGPDYEKGRAIM